MVRRYATAAVLQELRPQLFACYRSPLLPGSNTHMPANELIAVWHLEAGSAKVTIDRQTITLQAGDTIILPSGVSRDQDFSDDTELVSCRFSICWPDGRPLRIDNLPLRISQPDPLVTSMIELATYLADLPVHRYGPFDRSRLRFDQFISCNHLFFGVLRHVLACLEANHCTCHWLPSHDHRLERALAVIEQQADLTRVDYRALQAATGVSRAQVDRLFRHCLGRSPSTLLNERRLHLACEQLAEVTTPIRTIAAALQFCDAAHFRRWFFRRRRMSPSDYRGYLGSQQPSI